MKKDRLGRGLGALLGEYMEPAAASEKPQVGAIPLAAIVPNPFQPRREFSEEDLADLVASIRENGLLQPIVVRPAPGAPGQYELVAGERRWRATMRLGWKEVPATIREVDDRTLLVLALVENLQRADLNAVEEARGYRRLSEEFGYTHAQIAEAVGKDRTSITSLLRILQLPSQVLDIVEKGHLTAGHARALVSLEDPRRALSLANEAVALQLSVREMEKRVRDASQPPPQKRPTAKAATAPAGSPVLKRLEDELRRRLQTDVHIRLSGPERGAVEVAFYSADDLERVLDVVLGPQRERS
jgi:ParB family chromosome partitioning protein